MTSQVEFVDEFALIMESAGLTPLGGRALGELLVTDAPHLSLHDLRESLGASSGAVSTITRQLIGMGLLARVAVRGSRRDHVRLADHAWLDLVRWSMARSGQIRRLVDEHLSELDLGPSAQARVLQMRDFYSFLEGELPELLRRFLAEASTSAGSAVG